MNLHFVLHACLHGVEIYVMIVAKIIINCVLLVTTCVLCLICVTCVICTGVLCDYDIRFSKNENVRSEEECVVFVLFHSFVNEHCIILFHACVNKHHVKKTTLGADDRR